MKPVYCLVTYENGDKGGATTDIEGWLNITDDGVFSIQPSKVYDPDALHIHIPDRAIRYIYPQDVTAVTTLEKSSQSVGFDAEKVARTILRECAMMGDHK
jgi:hypothetical protein